MKFAATLLRSRGQRLTSLLSPRLVTLQLGHQAGVRLARLICCYGGLTVGELWEPTLSRVDEQAIYLRGFESDDRCGVVQEWRLVPHTSKEMGNEGTQR